MNPLERLASMQAPPGPMAARSYWTLSEAESMPLGLNWELARMCMLLLDNRRIGFPPAGISPSQVELSQPSRASASITEQRVSNPVITLIRPENHGVG